MIMGQSCTGTEFRPKDPLWRVNPLIFRQSAIFADVVTEKILGRWIEQCGKNEWDSIEVEDIDVVRCE